MVKHLVKQAVIVLTLCLLLPNSVCYAAEKQVAIVIDDFGNDVKGAQSFFTRKFSYHSSDYAFSRSIKRTSSYCK